MKSEKRPERCLYSIHCTKEPQYRVAFSKETCHLFEENAEHRQFLREETLRIFPSGKLSSRPLEPQAGSFQHAGVHLAILNLEHAWETVFPAFVTRRAKLPGVAFDRCHGRNTRCDGS